MSRKSAVLLLKLSLVLFVAGNAFAATLSGTVTTSKKGMAILKKKRYGV
jgi:hypothetical protein